MQTVDICERHVNDAGDTTYKLLGSVPALAWSDKAQQAVVDALGDFQFRSSFSTDKRKLGRPGKTWNCQGVVDAAAAAEATTDTGNEYTFGLCANSGREVMFLMGLSPSGFGAYEAAEVARGGHKNDVTIRGVNWIHHK